MRFWKLQDKGDAVPYGVIAADDQGLARLFVPGMGLVDVPSISAYIYNGEIGAQPITQTQARRMMRAGVGRVTPETVRSIQGTAPTIPIEA